MLITRKRPSGNTPPANYYYNTEGKIWPEGGFRVCGRKKAPPPTGGENRRRGDLGLIPRCRCCLTMQGLNLRYLMAGRRIPLQKAAGCAGLISCPIWAQVLNRPAGHLPHAPVGRSRPAALSWDCQTLRLQSGCKKPRVSWDPRRDFCEELL